MGFWGVNDPFSKKFRNSVPKEFMTTPVHVLCSNFTEIEKLVKRCVVLLTNKSAKCVFTRHFAPVWRRVPKVCREACHLTLGLPVEFRPIIIRLQYIPSVYKKQVRCHNRFDPPKLSIDQIVVFINIFCGAKAGSALSQAYTKTYSNTRS